MPIYEWKGFDATGKKASGIIDADSERDARTKCKRSGNLVTHVVETRGGKKVKSGSEKKGKPAKQSKLQKRLDAARGRGAGAPRSNAKTEDVATFTRQLATLTKAGIPITEALRAIIEQTENKRLSILFRDIRERISQGSPLADAIAAHPDYFDELNVSMVRAGEASGHLDEVLMKCGFHCGLNLLHSFNKGCKVHSALLIEQRDPQSCACGITDGGNVGQSTVRYESK